MKHLVDAIHVLCFIMLISGLSNAQATDVDCECSGEEPIVCALDEFGNEVSVPDCLAKCLSLEIIDCDSALVDVITGSTNPLCDCFAEIDPVCVLGQNGQVIKYRNSCEAFCDGYSPNQIFNCTDCYALIIAVPLDILGKTWAFGSITSGNIERYIWDFGDGHRTDEPITTHTYSERGTYVVTLTVIAENLCVYQARAIIKVGSCQCPDVVDPVCVVTQEGEIKRFGNACKAECAGYSTYGNCDDCICPEYYEPVCVITNTGDTLTFDNKCFARCAGYNDYFNCNDTCVCPLYFAYQPVCVVTDEGDTLLFDNECRAECAGYTDYYYCDDECFCPTDYAPVCVATSSGILTFDNKCIAECKGYKEYYDCSHCSCYDAGYRPVCVIRDDGQIEKFVNECFAKEAGFQSWSNCASQCDCPEDVYDPVCVVLDNGCELTFENECRARCDGFYEYTRCHDCICPDIYDPVCVLTDDGRTIEFSNECEARCAGYRNFIACEECYCPAIYQPVCVELPNGEIKKFDNECVAHCEGFTEIFECDGCYCPQIYDPVCAIGDDGDIIEFNNECEARCKGFDFFDCDDCLCPDIYDPVCVYTATGNILRFNNPCEAECEGYTQFFDCENDCNCSLDPNEPIVCVVTDSLGGICPFPNRCFAKCAGYGEEDIVDCNGGPQWGTCFECFYEPIKPVCVIIPEINQVILAPNACFASCLNLEIIDCTADTVPGVVDDIPQENARSGFVAEIRQNLSSRTIHLDIRAFENSIADLMVYDMNGLPVKQSNLELVTGTNSHRMDFNNFSNGMYILRIANARSSQTLKFLLLD